VPETSGINNSAMCKRNFFSFHLQCALIGYTKIRSSKEYKFLRTRIFVDAKKNGEFLFLTP